MNDRPAHPAPPERVPGPRPPLTTADACTLVADAHAHAAVLVEGWSDQAALETLARRRGCDLRAEGIVVVPIGGVTNLLKFGQALAPPGIALAGLYDLGEEPHIQRSLAKLGLAASRTRESTEAAGFFVCSADLEDELVRALGPAAVEQVLDAEGDLASFRRFQDQPAQRGRDTHAQLRRFMGTRSGRKIRYGALLVDALDLAQVPRPLDQVLAHLRR